MRAPVYPLLLLFLLTPVISLAADLNISSQTLLQLEKREVPGFKEDLAPLTEFLTINVGSLGQHGNISLHFSGWGRLDLGDDSTSDGSTNGDFSYGYLSYHFAEANGEFRAGRFFTFVGGIVDQLDGLQLKADLTPSGALGFTVYGGVPTHTDQGNEGDYLVGGRLAWRVPGLLELAALASYRGGVDSREYNANLHSYRKVADYQQLLGGEIRLTPHRTLDITGHTIYNTATSGIAENAYQATFRPLAELIVAADYRQNDLKDYFATTNLPRLFKPDKANTVTSFGGSINWTMAKQIDLFLDYRRYTSDQRNDSERFGGECRLSSLEGALRSAVGYHRVNVGATTFGNFDAYLPSSYHELRAYALYDKEKYTASLDGIVHLYDDDQYGKGSGYEFQASVGYRLLKSLTISGDLAYADNPQQDEEFRGVLRVTYLFDYTSKGAGR